MDWGIVRKQVQRMMVVISASLIMFKQSSQYGYGGIKWMSRYIPPQHGLSDNVGDVMAGCETSRVDEVADA